MKSQVSAKDSSEIEPNAISLSERLELIALIDEGTRVGSPDTPIVADLEKREELLMRIDFAMADARPGNARLRVNPQHLSAIGMDGLECQRIYVSMSK